MESIDYKKNCINIIRLLAAYQVIYGHAVYYLKIDIDYRISWFIDLFHGVPIFFTLSGFLIWMSIRSSRNYTQYLRKRFWRIYPELWVAVFVEIVTIIVFYKEEINWPQLSLFALTQGTVFQFWTPDFLRGFGSGTPNGALWCICVLIQFYLIAYPLYKLLHGKSIQKWLYYVSIFILIGCITPFLKDHLPLIIGKLYGQTIIPYLWMFLLAAFAAEKKDTVIPVLKKRWWLFLLMLLVIRYASFDVNASYYSYGLLETLCLFGGLMGFAYSYPQLNIKYDFSYGLYIYHSIILNIFIIKSYYYSLYYLIAVFLISSIIAIISMKTIGRLSSSKRLSV